MDIIALETDYVTPKTPDNTHLMFYEKHKNILMYDVIWCSFWNFAYKKGYLRLPVCQLS